MMRFDWNEVEKTMKKDPNTVLIVKVKNVDEHLFLLHGFGIHDDDNSTFTYPCYLYIRKNPWKGYNRSYDRGDVYSGEEKDMFGHKIIRREIINPTPKEILTDTINECKSKDGYAACVIVGDNYHEIYLAIDDNTLIEEYGYIEINSDLDDELNVLDSDGEPSGERITKIFTAKIESFSDYTLRNTVWTYDEDEDEDLARYCNEHNITTEDLVKYFGIKLDK